MRGSVSTELSPRISSGSIPAYAGFSCELSKRHNAGRVHPRVCGVQVISEAEKYSAKGPSPRMRGSGDCGSSWSVAKGSIPAYAGFSRSPCARQKSGKVHPRVCGVQRRADRHIYRRRGPSPRMRGSVTGVERRPVLRGSIPAYAGFSIPAMKIHRVAWVHPRVCGVQLILVADLCPV